MAEEKKTNIKAISKDNLGIISGGTAVYDVTDGHKFHIQTNSLNDDIKFANEYKRVTKHSVRLINDDGTHTNKEITDANIKINGLLDTFLVQKIYEKLQGTHKGRKGGGFGQDYRVEKIGPKA